jgi:hypothetical protein
MRILYNRKVSKLGWRKRPSEHDRGKEVCRQVLVAFEAGCSLVTALLKARMPALPPSAGRPKAFIGHEAPASSDEA